MATPTKEQRVTATLNINYGASDSANGLVLEVDDREDGLNQGNTSFGPGDTVYYLRYVADHITIDIDFVTAGSATSAGSGSREVEEYLTFANANSGGLRYPVSGKLTTEWVGKYKVIGGTGTPAISLKDQMEVKLDRYVVGLLKATYDADYTAFKLHNVPDSIDQVLVFCSGYVDR